LAKVFPRFRQLSRQRCVVRPELLTDASVIARRGGEFFADAMCWLRVDGCDGAAGTHGTGIPKVSLPGMPEAFQRAQHRCTKPRAVPKRRDCARGLLAALLQVELV
jgi:hypothetical protein